MVDTISSGEAILEKIMPGGVSRLRQGMEGIAPDLSQYILDFVFGTLYARSGLDIETKQLLTITILATLGTARPQLEYHIKGALNLGIPREKIVDAFLHLTAYAGFPAANNAVSAAKAVFEKEDSARPAA
jgi:4-carboxymuconolactone decarboxylase